MSQEVQHSDLCGRSPLELLHLHSAAAEELQRRGLTRSANSPLGDLTEHLCCSAFGWIIAPKSMPAADAVGPDGLRYQIKARRLLEPNGSRQLGAIRNLDRDGFDHLAAVLYDTRYRVIRGALIPVAIVKAKSRFHKHTNSSILMLADQVWLYDGVVDITAQLRSAATTWERS